MDTWERLGHCEQNWFLISLGDCMMQWSRIHTGDKHSSQEHATGAY